MKSKIIAISGKLNSGIYEFSSQITEAIESSIYNYKTVVLSFNDLPEKIVVNITKDYSNDINKILPKFIFNGSNMKHIELFQKTVNFFRSMNDDVFVDDVIETAKKRSLEENTFVIITGLNFKNELKQVEEAFGTTVRITKPQALRIPVYAIVSPSSPYGKNHSHSLYDIHEDKTMKHLGAVYASSKEDAVEVFYSVDKITNDISETELDDAEFDFVVENIGDISQNIENAKIIVNKILSEINE